MSEMLSQLINRSRTEKNYITIVHLREKRETTRGNGRATCSFNLLFQKIMKDCAKDCLSAAKASEE